MTKQKRNKVIAAVAVLLIAVAGFLTVMLFVADSVSDKKSDSKTSTAVAAGEENKTSDSQPTTSAPAKYLWEYGPDDSKFEKPSKLK